MRISAKSAGRLGAKQLLGLALLMAVASCVPAAQGGPAALSRHGGMIPQTPSAAAADEAAPFVGEEAILLNVALPFTRGANPASPSFVLGGDGGVQLRALECLAAAVYYEAASESEDGQRAVAQVVLNRVRHPAYPDSVCGVVYQGPQRAGGGCQFTFTCDGSLARRPSAAGWRQAHRIAADALAGKVHAGVGHATHYHTFQVHPHWAPKLAKVAAIGAHFFYRFPGPNGRPGAFSRRHAGIEPRAAPAFLPQPAGETIGDADFAAAPSGPRLKVAPAVLEAASSEAAKASPDLPPAPVVSRLPQSRVRAEFANSGRMRETPAG
ncbi:MAG: cell wall hydrolase [Sphingomonadaceae bacterium]